MLAAVFVVAAVVLGEVGTRLSIRLANCFRFRASLGWVLSPLPLALSLSEALFAVLKVG